MKTEHFLIKPRFASANNLPVSFIATRVKETNKAVWVVGHGAMDPEGHCARCGRTLTHPGSILIGIGPECLGSWGARDARLENMTEKDKQYLKSLVTDRVVDAWIPKAAIKKLTHSSEEINVPTDHKSQVPQPSATLPAGNQTTQEKKNELSKRAREWKGEIAIVFPYSYDTLLKVKSLDKRKYHGEGTTKYWTCPLSVEAILKLKEWGFELDGSLAKYVIENIEVPAPHSNTVKKPVQIDDIGLKRNLFPYQKEGVQFVDSRNGRALIADEMGLGKTIQALAYLQLHSEIRPALIVCPASLKLNWAKEIVETMTVKTRTQILEGRSTHKIHGEIVIINYDLLPYWLEALKLAKFEIIIADECHYFKSSSAKRTKAIKLLAKGVPHFIALSGTPIVNRPIEIYNALSIINSKSIPGFWDYAKRYCGAKNNGFGWDFTGATNTEELHKILTESVMIRRKKADVLKDLPNKMYSFVPMTLDNWEEYGRIEDDVISYLREAKGDKAADSASNAEIITQIEYLKQAAVKGKLKAVLEWVEDFLESGEKLVMFATHSFVINALMERFATVSVKIDGSMNSTRKQEAVNAFQTLPSIKLIVANIQAGGVGHTLTAASNVGFIEYPWTPGELKQAEDRLHRITQKYTVNVHFLMVLGTIEEKIAILLDKKTKVLDAVLDGKETKQDSLLYELMNSLTNKTKTPLLLK
jgi:SWI/SNF-related matrix-associated actin-dependent regulator 1 of chromatin subfamily A